MKYALISVRGNCELLKHFFPFLVELRGTLKEKLEKAFRYYNVVVFVGSIGVLFRQINEMITSKFVDPAVIVIDEMFKFCIPVLSAHLGGASDICLELNKRVGCQPVFTTATDVNGVLGIDRLARRYNFAFLYREGIRDVNRKLLEGKGVTVTGDVGKMKIPRGYRYVSGKADVGIGRRGAMVTLIPRDLALGVGFHSGVDVSDIYREYIDLLPLDLRLRVSVAATLRDKWKTAVFHEFSKLIGALHTRGYTVDEIKRSEKLMGIPFNEVVEGYMGVSAVAKPNGYMASQMGTEVLTVKGKVSKFSLFRIENLMWQEGIFDSEEVPDPIR